MHFLNDGCAFIMSGFTLYNGLSTNEGIVAAYGKGLYAHTLIKHETFNSKDELKNMLKLNSENSIRIKEYNSGPVDFSVCVNPLAGTSGIENYLSNRGFISSRDETVFEAADILMNKIKELPQNTIVPVNEISNGNSNKGREIASAISMNLVTLTGKYGCASNIGAKSKYTIDMNSPLDMGEIKFKVMIKLSQNVMKGLVFINGGLRILSSTGIREQPYNEAIWDTFPKFDKRKNSGLLSRLSLDVLLYSIYDFNVLDMQKDKVNRLYLGCYKDKR